jgi:hypothetical protein
MAQIEVKRLSPAIRSALASVKYGARDISVVPATEVSLTVSGGAGQRGFATLVDMVTGRHETMMGSWGGANMFTPRNRVDLDTTKRTLPPGTVLIKGEEGYPRTFATIYAHPDLLQSLSLAAPAAPLSDVEGKVLNIYGGIKSGYRQDELRRKDISPQAAAAAVRSLIAAGYLAQNKSGAVSITTAGKNARPSGYYRRRPSALQVELARRSRQARQQPRHRDGRFSKRRR